MLSSGVFQFRYRHALRKAELAHNLYGARERKDLLQELRWKLSQREAFDTCGSQPGAALVRSTHEKSPAAVARKFDHDPKEAEAYWLQTKPKRWKRWADEFRHSGKWVGWHFERDEAETSAAAESDQHS